MSLTIKKILTVAVSNCHDLYSYIKIYGFLLIYLVLVQNCRKSTHWKVFIGVSRSGVGLGEFLAAHTNTYIQVRSGLITYRSNLSSHFYLQQIV